MAGRPKPLGPLNLPMQAAVPPVQPIISPPLEIHTPSGILVDPNAMPPMVEIGSGAFGRVMRVVFTDKATNKTDAIAIKLIPLTNLQGDKESSLLMEVKVLREAECPYIVSYYGSYIREGELALCMEFMDGGSWQNILQKEISIPEDILGKITVSVVKGLDYLKTKHKTIHRDVKPSNILLNRHGDIKLCDFGISGTLLNSVAKTYVGTNLYMCPERITGTAKNYGVESDVWSLGVTLIELATGKHPYLDTSDAKPAGIFAVIQQIVNKDPPTLPGDKFSKDCCDFVRLCLLKEPSQRPKYSVLLTHPFIKKYEVEVVDVGAWVKKVLDTPVAVKA